MKQCSKCGEWKSLDEFSNCSTTKDKKQHQCKVCKHNYYINNKEYLAEYKRQYYIDNREYFTERNKQYRDDNMEYFTEYQKQYYIDNKEYIDIRSKQYYNDNKGFIIKQKKQYAIDNPAKIIQYTNKQRATRKGWESPLPINSWFENSHLHHLHLVDEETGEIDHRIAIYIPDELHKSIWHSNKIQSTMDAINKVVLMWYEEQVEQIEEEEICLRIKL